MKRVIIKSNNCPEPPICSEVEVDYPPDEEVIANINYYINSNNFISACIEASNNVVKDNVLASVFYTCRTLKNIKYESKASDLLFREAYELLKSKLSCNNNLCKKVYYML